MDGPPKKDEAGTGPVLRSTSGSPAELAGDQASRHILIMSEVRFLRESLGEVLARDGAFAIAGLAADLGEALAVTVVQPPQVILIDAASSGGLDAALQLRKAVPEAQLVALGLTETEAEVIAWAKSGVCGYVPRSTALSELVGFLAMIMRGEQACSTRIAAGLLRWIADRPRGVEADQAAGEPALLTPREEQVAQLVGAGLSNKEIARHLNIGVATIKSHVHNLLGKLALGRRSQVAHWARTRAPNSWNTGLPQWRVMATGGVPAGSSASYP